MTVAPNPYVALQFSDLTPDALKQVDNRSLGTPREQIEAALMTYRLLVINHAKRQLMGKARVDGVMLMQAVDMASQIYLGKFTKLAGPSAIQAYVRAYRAANAGDIPMTTLYALAEQHSERMGTYFHESSKEALAQGFNKYVNNKVPQKVAADRVLDAFGLTPRQMNGYVALEPLGKVATSEPRSLKAKGLNYITKALRSRFKVFAEQEIHNLDLQAQQTAWMWLLDKGAITGEATKVWITARDEKVCRQCGPMHGKKVSLADRFELPNRVELYVPGAHPNCRCTVRLVDPGQVRKDLGGADLAEFNEEHPRDGSGKFSAKARTRTADMPDLSSFQAFLDTAKVEEEKPKVVLERPRQRMVFRPMSSAVSLRPEPEVEEEKPQVVLQRPQASARVAPQRPSLVLRPEPGIKLERPGQVVLTPATEAKPLIKPTTREYMRPKVEKLPVSIYKVLGPQDFEGTGGFMAYQFQFANDGFHADEQSAIEEAAQLRNNLMADKYDLLTMHGEMEKVPFRIYDHTEGAYVHGMISKDTVETVIEQMVRYEDGDEFDLHEWHQVDLFDYDSVHMMSKNLDPVTVAEGLGIYAGDFKVAVLSVDTVHNSKHGTYNHDSGTRHGNEEWTLTGNYTTYEEGVGEPSNSHVGIPIFFLEPDDPEMERWEE